jgi:hypothetical protein
MKKKVFSLMMTLLLAFMGVAKAETIEIGTGTSTSYYVPFNSLYGYSFTEQVYSASDIGTAGNINSISFYLGTSNSSVQTNDITLYMKNVSRSEFSSTTDYEAVTTGDIVYSGSWTIPANYTGWVSIPLTTPFAYDGTSNLMVAMHEYTSGYSTRYFTYTSVTNASVQWYSDSYNPDPYNLGSYSGSVYTRNYLGNAQLEITAGGGGGETVEVTIGDPTSTTSSSYLPTYSLYEYSLTQQIYTADEIGVGGTINSLTMWLQNTSSYARNLNFYLKEVSESAFASGSAWVSMSASDLVGTTTLANGISSFTETTINLSTPFSYTGNGNLVLCVQDVTGSWSSGAYGNTLAADGNQALYAYRDGTVYDPSAPGVTGYTLTTKNVLRLSITTEGGGGQGGFEDKLHVKYMDGETEVIDTLNLGVRPAGAWMEPFNFTMYSEGPVYTVNVLDFTPSDGMFSVEGEELPFQVNTDGVELVMNVNTADTGVIERQFVAITEGDRAAHIWPVMVELYAPECPDVVEVAYDLGTIDAGYTYEGIPSEITPTVLHNDYTLPFPEIPEGEDAVYKFTVDNDVIISAWVDSTAENGKVALYTEDFYGEGGPMATNNYTGLSAAGGGSAAAPFEAQIGDGTSTTGYMPFYCFYNYSISQQLFLAAELEEAGVTRAPMTSLSWYCTATNGNLQSNITIWMANVEETAIGGNSIMTGGMTKVYTGNMTPTVGWDEFVFNEGTFAWDGHSNILISVQRNNGAWASGINWQCGTQSFTASGYSYNDSQGAYNMETNSYVFGTSGSSYGGTTTTRSNIIMKGGNRGDRAGRDVVEIGDGTGTTYYFPIDNYFNYSCTEQIYTADEIGTAGTINSISFYYNYGTAYTADNVTMYMKNVERSSFDTNDDCEPLELGDIVWTGSIAPTAAGWYTFNLDTPFYYDGTSNLMVAFFDGTSGYPGTSYTWRQTATPGSTNMALRYYSDSSCPDPYNLASYGGSKMRYTYRSNIQLDITPGSGSSACAGPVITDLGLTPGTYYLVASATQADYTVYINMDEMPCPAIEAEGFAFNPQPADDEDEIEPASVTLRWMVPEYATGWRLVFGSTYHPDPNHPQTIMYPEDGSFTTDMANSYTVRNLWNNTNYFWHVEFNNTACPEGVSSPIWGFTTHLNVPQNLTAVDETVFNDEQIVLNWTAVVDRTYRFYNVYRDGELIGNTQVNNISNTTYTDGPLAYNMEGYTYYVTAVYDEGESAPSNEVTVKVSGRGNVDGHVYEQDGTTGIANATVTMVGPDEFGVNHTYNFTTNAQGYYSGAVYAGPRYDGQAAKEGYQTAYEPVQGEPIVIVYNETTSPIDYILDENFDPVCTVIAEYYPDSLDPNSPYVKVYWGCGLPGEEIIEPFETGDFSLFDWQVDPTYPWTVTTTNPYEGTYCMKSGGAGVANVVSNMTVTVNIPADGIMSYYGKISCESNWDYGYFFIDGVQKAQYTGTSNWAEKHFDITAGDHTFQWRYTKDGSVNSNDDCFYVDYITFYKRPEPPQPAQPGWHTYAEGDFNNAVGSNVGTSRWAYEYPVSVLGGYAGFNMTKVSLFSDNMYSAVGGNYTCTIYQGGTLPMEGTAVSTITVDVPGNQNAWVDFDLTTPVSITGSEKLWVVWTANSTVSSWPAGCCDGLVDEGTWWNPGVEAGYEWEHETYGTWTMRQYFTNGAKGFYSYASENAPVAVEAPVVVKGAPVMPVKGQEIVATSCANPNAVPGARVANVNRSLNHYRVYRTNCYQECPFTEENTVLLATVWVPDTVYIDVEWADLEPGVYKWGVGAVYEGNRGELIEAPINWAAPVTITRSATADNDPNPVAGEEGVRAPWDLMATFNAPEAAHYGVVTDGQYIYTSNWGYASATHNFYKYDMQGNMIEGFEIPGCGTLRGMTFDGQHIYGVANSNTVYCVDLNSHTLVSTFTSSYGAMRGISYDPERNGFWVIGNWSGNLTLIDYNGAVQFTGPTPTSVSDLAYYKDENDVEHVFCFNNGDNGVYDYNITTNTLGGSVFNFSATPGFDAGSSGGCHVAEYNGKMAFFGDIQQDPNLIGIYELRDGGGVGPAPVPGSDNCNQLALPRESETVWSNCLDKDMYIIGENQDGVTVNVLLNSADSPEGVQVTFTNYNEAEQELYPIEPIVLDETGFYAFDSFRRGNYKVNVTFDGYEPIEDSVSIWEPVDLRYVMIEIIYGVNDLYVSSTGWAMWDAEGMPTPGGGGGGQGGNGDTFSENFDAGMPAGWTTVDADGDGYTWVSSMTPGNYHNAGVNLSGTGHNASEAYVISGSWANGTGQVLYPDNYLVSPQVNLAAGSTFSFWACAQDASYPADHFGVAISSNGTSDWTMVNEWTMTAKGTGAMSYGRDGDNRAQGNWYNYSVDLSAYAGQKYIAIRHFNCYDQFILNVDDIELTNGAKSGDRHLEYFKVMCTSIDGEPIFNANSEHPFCQVATDQLVPGNHYIAKVAAMYSTGMSAWTECEWQYIPCDNYAGTLNGVEVNGTEISWEYPGGGPVPPGQGDSFSVDFEAGMPAGWNVIDGNNDGWTWCMTSNIPSTWTYYAGMSLDWYHNGTNAICSGSYINGVGALTPDEYLVSPQVTLASGSTFSFYAAATDASYAADHFGVFVSDNGTSDWTMVNEWTLTAKNGAKAGDLRASRDGNGNRLGNWYSYTVDLSNFAGQKYIAIRHFNCNDQYIMCVDDIELTSGAKNRDTEVIFNGFVTDPGAMANGADASWIKGSQSTWGPNVNNGGGYKLADSFTLSAATTISEIEVYGYQTGSSTTSTFTGLYAQIFNGNPMSGGTAVWGSETTNIMTATAFTNCYRGSDGETTATTRPIMSITAGNLNIQLEAGTYWLVYSLEGTGSSGPWGAPHCEPSIGNTGNGVQYTTTGWQTLTDSGAGTPYGCAMKIMGAGGAPVPPTPTGDLIGAMIFVDGEWVAEVPYPTNTYTYEGEGEEVCVRMIYNGTNNLPEGNIYYSMSCPECEALEPGIATCEPGAPIHSELVDANHIKVWWGNAPAAPVSDWLYYDDGTNEDAIGLQNGGSFYWGIKFPAAAMSQYEGCSVTKIGYFDYTAHTGTVRIYNGSNGNAPGTLIGTYDYTATGTSDWVEWTIPAVAFDNTQDLWIVMNNANGQYVAALGPYTGDPNGTMISTDGSTWYTLDDATGGQLSGTWNLRCYVTNQAKGGEIVALDDELNGTPGGVIANSGVSKHGEAPAYMTRAELVKYNVYRSTEATGTYTLIGEVAATGADYYEYIDSPTEAGTYYYQVRAEYDNECESEPAEAADDPSVNYVSETTTAQGVDENGSNVALYPNPTKGNVTIEAEGMSRITVVSVLGQVVFDTELDADTYTLNMSQFNAGMYMVRVYTEGGVTVKRVTVMQ